MEVCGWWSILPVYLLQIIDNIASIQVVVLVYGAVNPISQVKNYQILNMYYTIPDLIFGSLVSLYISLVNFSV